MKVFEQTALMQSVQRILDVYKEGRQESLVWWQRGLATTLQVILLTIREMKRDRLIQEAASLAFFTILSLVPLLAVVTALLGAYGVFDPVEGDLAVYLEVLFPAAGMEIVEYLQEFSSRGASSIGGINGIVLLVISIFLFNSIERSLTNIWNGTHNRSVVSKFLMFYTMITLGPLLIILSVVQTASAQLYVTSKFGIDTSSLNHFLPMLYTLLVFTLMNKILPHVYVSLRAALIGGVVTATGFELAKWGFNQYVNLVLIDSYNQLYGAMGVIPIVLLWIYITWMVILIGSEIAYCYQNMFQLLRYDMPLDRWLMNPIGNDGLGGERAFDVLIGVQVLEPVANIFHLGGGSVSEEQVLRCTGYEPEVVQGVLDELVKGKVLINLDKTSSRMRRFIPAKPLEMISLWEVIEVFTSMEYGVAGTCSTTMRVEFIEELKESFEDRSALDLIDRDFGWSEFLGIRERDAHEVHGEPEDELDEL